MITKKTQFIHNPQHLRGVRFSFAGSQTNGGEQQLQTNGDDQQRISSYPRSMLGLSNIHNFCSSPSLLLGAR
jgi:hypothetical protein